MPLPIGLLIVAARAAAAASNGGRGGGSSGFRPSRTTVSSERLAAVGIWAIGVPVGGGVIAGMIGSGDPAGIAVGSVAILAMVGLLFPWPIVRALFIPLGWHRAAHQLTRVSLWVWGGDREGGAVVAGALAAGRVGDVDKRRAALGWLDARVLAAKKGHGALLVGQSLLARLRGEHERADRLLHAAALMPDEITPVIVRAWSSEAAIVAALAQGNLELARRFRGRGSRVAWLLQWCTAALVEAPPAPTTSRVVSAWRAVARAARKARIRMVARTCLPWASWRRLVRDAVDAIDRLGDANNSSAREDDGAAVAPDFDDAEHDDDVSNTQRAVLWLARAKKSGAAMNNLGVAEFGEALDDAVFELSEIDLDGDMHDAAEDALAQAAQSVAAVWSNKQRESATSSTLTRVLDAGNGADELGDACEQWRDRHEPQMAAAELEEWARLRALYERALADAGDDSAMAPYLMVRDVVWNHSAMIFNKGLKGLGRSMFQFLLVEATKRKDESAIKGMVKNLRAA